MSKVKNIINKENDIKIKKNIHFYKYLWNINNFFFAVKLQKHSLYNMVVAMENRASKRPVLALCLPLEVCSLSY